MSRISSAVTSARVACGIATGETDRQISGRAEQPHRRPGDTGQHVQRVRGQHRPPFRALHRDPLRGQLPEHQRDEAQHRGDQQDRHRLPQVDPDRIALWGTSLSAGHVISVAARDPRIAAVVAQLPFLGVDVRHASPRSGRVTRALFAAAVRDKLGGLVGRPPVVVPMVGKPDTVAVFTGSEDYAVAQSLAGSAPAWRNEMAARSLFSLIRYRPGLLAGRLTMPLLVCAAEGDTAASVPLAIRAAEQAPRGQLRRYPGGHFAAYLGGVFEQMVTDQVAFLRRHPGTRLRRHHRHGRLTRHSAPGRPAGGATRHATDHAGRDAGRVISAIRSYSANRASIPRRRRCRRSAAMNMPSPARACPAMTCWLKSRRVSWAGSRPAMSSRTAGRSRVVCTPQDGEPPTPTTDSTVWRLRK
jgi:hypothetical protein